MRRTCPSSWRAGSGCPPWRTSCSRASGRSRSPRLRSRATAGGNRALARIPRRRPDRPGRAHRPRRGLGRVARQRRRRLRREPGATRPARRARWLAVGEQVGVASRRASTGWTPTGRPCRTVCCDRIATACSEDLRAVRSRPLRLLRDPPRSWCGTGQLIPHDDDADLAYLSAPRAPGRRGAARTWRAERARSASGGIRVTAAQRRAPPADASTSTARGAGPLHRRLHGLHARRGAPTCASRSAPTRSTSARLGEARRPWAGRSRRPSRPSALLAATYGPGWRVPDPSFTFTTPHAVRSRLRYLVRRVQHGSSDHWQDFYSSSQAADRVPVEESDLRPLGARPARRRRRRSSTWARARRATRGSSPDEGPPGHRRGLLRGRRERARSSRRPGRRAGRPGLLGVVNLGRPPVQVGGVGRRAWTAAVGWHLYARFLVHAIDDADARQPVDARGRASPGAAGSAGWSSAPSEDAEGRAGLRRALPPLPAYRRRRRGAARPRARHPRAGRGPGARAHRDEGPLVTHLPVGAADRRRPDDHARLGQPGGPGTGRERRPAARRPREELQERLARLEAELHDVRVHAGRADDALARLTDGLAATSSTLEHDLAEARRLSTGSRR